MPHYSELHMRWLWLRGHLFVFLKMLFGSDFDNQVQIVVVVPS